MSNEPRDHSQEPLVAWMAGARRDLSDAFCLQLDSEFLQAFPQSGTTRIFVKQRFLGFADTPEQKLILAVEVHDSRGSHSSVVKIGDANAVSGDDVGWQTCAVQRGVSSRMFIAPVLRSLADGRAAIIYEDVYQYYFDNGRDDQPQELEAIVEQSILRDMPTYSSVERVLTQVYTEAHRCFYRFAKEDTTCEQVQLAMTRSLRVDESDPVMPRWQEPEFLELRRGAVWLTCGHRKPESLARPEYIDPIDYLAWAIERQRFPSMLIGPAHGDLHGRNVIVGVVRGEAEWPAVFDFDRMANCNLIAWDFAKLELELKCRLFQQLLDTPVEQTQLRKLLGIPVKRPLPAEIELTAEERRIQQRADRMEIMFGIENLLCNWTRQISSLGQAIRNDVEFLPDVPADTPLGRALRIIFRIRREAAVYLGFERQGRESLWSDEYYLALASYGVVMAKWHSANDHMAWALLSAGVASANLSQLPWPPASTVAPSISDVPTYLHLLPYSATCWRAENWSAPIPLLKAGIKKFPYAVALRQQLALLQAQSDNPVDDEEARRAIETLANLACVFRDHETLCRLGRIYKDRGDRHNHGQVSCEEVIAQSLPPFQYYRSAFKHYETAFQISNSYYPAVNAATLASLIGNHDRKAELAQQVLGLCTKLPLDGDDRVWVLASEGEASLLLGHTSQAVKFYKGTLEGILQHEVGVMQSIYDQLCRLHWALGAEVVQPVIDMLEQAGRLTGLKPGSFNNCGRT